MKGIRWSELRVSVRVAAAAFALHALLVLVDLVVFHGMYSGAATAWYWPLLRILAFSLLVCALVLDESRPWLLGTMAFFAFFLSDLLRLGEARDSLGSVPGLLVLSAALLLSLVVGIGASWWPQGRTAGPAG
jgi:hypothetical protein